MVEVWPENRLPVLFFIGLSTKWMHGFNGPTGLDETAVQARLAVFARRHGLTQEQADDILDCVDVMERAALAEMHKK